MEMSRLSSERFGGAVDGGFAAAMDLQDRPGSQGCFLEESEIMNVKKHGKRLVTQSQEKNRKSRNRSRPTCGDRGLIVNVVRVHYRLGDGHGVGLGVDCMTMCVDMVAG